LNDEVFPAKVGSVDAEGVTLILPGQSSASIKKYPRLASASLSAGDRVLCVRDSGTIVVLDKIV